MHRIEAYFRLAIIFIIIISILYIPIYFILKKKNINFFRQLSYIGLFYSIFLIIFATILFVPLSFKPEQYVLNLNPLDWLNNINSTYQFIVEKIPNIILFIPFGFFLPVVFKSKRNFIKVILISFLFTFSIELLQYFGGRSSDIVDVITNLLGAIIGYGVYKLFCLVFKNNNVWKKLINKK